MGATSTAEPMVLCTQASALYNIVSNPLFVDGSAGFLRRLALWRTARPVVVLISAVVLAALAQDRDGRPALFIASAALVGVPIIAALCLRTSLEDHPVRAVYVLEIEVVGRVLAVTVGLAALVYAMASLTERFQSRVPAYFVGLVAGAAVGYFSKEIFKSSENDSWFALNFQHRMNSIYKPFFYHRDPGTGEWVTTPPARWRPDGIMSDALSYHQYKNEQGENVGGWSWQARRTRARTIGRGLQDPPDAIQYPVLPGNDAAAFTAGTGQGTGAAKTIPGEAAAETQSPDPTE